MMPSVFLSFSVDAAFGMIMIAVIITFYRLAKGPTFADRVVALDMMTVSIIAFCGVFAIFSGDVAFLDIVIVLALIGFLATVALARFAERRTEQQKADDSISEERDA